MFRIRVNGGSPHEAVFSSEGLQLNGESLAWDRIEVAPGVFHLLYGAQSYTAEVLAADYAGKSFTFRINGQVLTVHAQDRFDLLLEKLGMGGASSARVNEIKAPMPGLILEVKVSEGQTVQKGDALLILEAMKMENVLKAPADGLVKSIRVNKGQSVEKNSVLVVFG